MADSNITKRILGVALKGLMEEVPFKKISVADICEKCGMNRKSFYYHFKDKYDLVNWIFDTEFIAMANDRADNDPWPFMEKMCAYFYDNRSFYYKVLQVQGQNSFGEHFREFIYPLLRDRIEGILGTKDLHEMCIDFFADGVVCAIMRWLLNKDCMKPEEFVGIIRNLVQSTATFVYQDMTQQ